LFAALFAVAEKSRLNIIYFIASATAFALCLITGDGGDAGRVAIACAMVLLIPYWISDRERLGKLMLVLASWCAVYALFNGYVYLLKKQLSDKARFEVLDRRFLESFEPKNFFLFIFIAVILFGIGLALIFLIKKWAVRPLKIAGIIFLPVIFISGILFVLFMGGRWSDDPNNIIWQAREILHGRFGDKFGSGRGWIWKNAFAVLFDRPVLGSGPDTFYYALGDVRQLDAKEIFNLTYDKAHNVFLQIAICMGLPAVFAYITFVAGLFVSAVKKAFERPVLLAFGAAALSYMIQSFFCVEVPITTPLVWIAFGVIAREIWLDKIGVKSVEV
jgi:O-antigen ligase